MQHELVDEVLKIARKRREILEQMRQAIRADDKDLLLSLAKKLTGIQDEECNRIDSRVH
jgi:hypothetical protein